MKKQRGWFIGQLLMYLPLAGILYASFLNLSAFQHQVLMLLVIVWVNLFFLYKAWLARFLPVLTVS
jgi:hypothetical protein